MKRKLLYILGTYAPLLAGVLAIVAAWIGLRHANVHPGDRFGTYLLVLTGVGFILASIVIFIFTREWTIQNVGQFLVYVADAWVWGGLGASRLGWRDPIIGGELLGIRATFLVGSACFVIGLMIFLTRNVVTLVRRTLSWRKHGQQLENPFR